MLKLDSGSYKRDVSFDDLGLIKKLKIVNNLQIPN